MIIVLFFYFFEKLKNNKFSLEISVLSISNLASSYELILPLFYKDRFGIKNPVKVNMPLNKTNFR